MLPECPKADDGRVSIPVSRGRSCLHLLDEVEANYTVDDSVGRDTDGVPSEPTSLTMRSNSRGHLCVGDELDGMAGSPAKAEAKVNSKWGFL